MKISEVEAYPVNVPLIDFEDGGIAPYRTNHNELFDMDRVLVRVETDDGLEGWGEVRAFLDPSVTVDILEKGVGPMVLGRSPYELEGFGRRLFTEYANADMFFAPIEMACWDIVGRDLGRPVYELLGGWTAPVPTERKHRKHLDHDPSREIELAYCMGIMPPEESGRRAERVLDLGYDVLKVKAGRDWRKDAERVMAMEDRVGGELEFRVDPNQGWSFEDAVRFAARLGDACVYLQYMEQPIRVNCHGDLARLRERTRQPIAANEDTYIEQNLGRMMDKDAIDVAVLDMTPLGGITGLRKAAGLAEEGGISTTHHCAFDLGVRTSAILHAVLGIPGFNLPIDTTYYGWEGDVLSEPFEIREGRMTVPDSPGLGVEVDMDKLEKYETS